MKKLIMFVMVLAMASSSLGAYEGDLVDVRPEIDTSGGVTTAVWDFATEPLLNEWETTTPPDCIDPDSSGSFLATIFDATWEDGVLSGSIWYSVEVPEGGDYFTLRGQVHMAEGSDPPAWVEAQFMDCVSTEVDGCRLEDPYEEIDDPEVIDNVAIFQVTMERGDIVAAGGFIQGSDFVESGDRRYTGLIVDVIVHDTEEPPSGERESECFVYSGPKNPLVVDPNVLTVYETGETVGDFDVSLKFPPVKQGDPGEGSPYTLTVTVDPNAAGDGPNPDLRLPAGTGFGNTTTLTFDTGNWNVPQTVIFEAIDDAIAEPPDLIELSNIGVIITSIVAEPNLNGPEPGTPWTASATAQITDNDQANILFTYSLPEKAAPFAAVTGPVQLWEDIRVRYGSPYIRWRNIGVTLQVPPTGDPVKIIMTNELGAGNSPITDPPLGTADDPNALIFTAANYDVTQNVKVWGNDDDVLQAEEAAAEGDQNYRATLVFYVLDDGGDTRFTEMERIVQLDIEDNECGAFGRLAMDISNPYYITDPNYSENDPDCAVNIHDIVYIAKRWIDCTDPQNPGCFGE